MKKIIALMILTLIYCPAQSQWSLQFTSGTISPNALDIVDNQTAYVVGTGSTREVLKTTNGGINWTSITLGPGALIFYDVKFLNINTGYIAGQAGAFYKTTNGGVNWQLLNTGTNRAFQCIDFINENTGFGSGDNGMVRKTTNGGIKWDTIDVPASNTVSGMDFIDANTGFITVFQTMYKTTNGGTSWQSTVLSTLYNVNMVNSTIGFATGYNSQGYVYKTTNTGASWQQIATGLPASLEGTVFTSPGTGYLYGFYMPGGNPSSYIAKTTNGGLNWYPQNSPVQGRIFDLDFSSADTGMAVTGENILFTGNGGGTTSINTISLEIPNKFSLYQNYPNPFNPSTKIRFDISSASETKLTVYDMLGKEVLILVNKKLPAGQYEYTFDAADLISGVYFYKLETTGYTATKKMILLK